jgi:hypothetical protein
MTGERDKANENPYRCVRVEGTKDGLVAFITSSTIVTETEVSELGADLLSIVQLATRIDTPLFLNFREVERISSALIGKVVVTNKLLKAAGQTLKLYEMSPEVGKVFRKFGGGGAGSMALLK